MSNSKGLRNRFLPVVHIQAMNQLRPFLGFVGSMTPSEPDPELFAEHRRRSFQRLVHDPCIYTFRATAVLASSTKVAFYSTIQHGCFRTIDRFSAEAMATASPCLGPKGVRLS